MTKRVAIIGAGPSGLAQLRAFKSAKEKEQTFRKLSVSKSNLTGEDCGTIPGVPDWMSTENPCMAVCTAICGRMGPRKVLSLPIILLKNILVGPLLRTRHALILFDYIVGRVEKVGVRDMIRFSSSVRHVTYDDASGIFTVVVQEHAKDSEYSEEFDYVIVASGHFSTPNVPHFDGFDSFPGRILHAHDFRDAMEFKGKDILIIGTSYSAEDIGSQCWKYGAKFITVSHRTAPMGFDWPDNWKEVPLLQKVEGNTATFKDGSTRDVDAIILCTGYLHHFPFMAEEMKLKTNNRLYPVNLYNGVVWEYNPKLMYLGMQDQWYTFNMFDAQAWYARDLIMGRLEVPTQPEMHADIEKWREAEDNIPDDYDAIKFQGDYTLHLMAMTDYPDFDTAESDQAFYEWKKHKKQNIMTFRDFGHKSALTGTMAPAHHTPWEEALDDSMESYLGT